MSTITLEDGKYTVVNTNGALTALRYGEPWRDCAGDGLMLALVHEIERLQAEQEHVRELVQAASVLHDFPGDTAARTRVDEAITMLDHLLEEK